MTTKNKNTRHRNRGGLLSFIFYPLSSRRGFTVVELLVVVSIIGLLAALIFVQLESSRTRGRDAEREQEIKSIQTSLAIYEVDRRRYPPSAGAFPYGPAALTGTDIVSQDLITSGSFAQMPKDPLNLGNYVYQYASVDGSSYTITYYLETDTILGKKSSQNPQIATP